MSFWIVFQKIIQLFLIVLIGFAANKLHFFNRDLREKVTALVLNITLPGVILSTVWGERDLPSPGQFLLYFAMVLLFFAVQFAVGKLAAGLIPFPQTMRGLVRFALLFATVGFMGYPVVQSIFGQKGMFYTTMVNLPFNVLILWIGASMLLAVKYRVNEDTMARLISLSVLCSGVTIPVIAAIVT